MFWLPAGGLVVIATASFVIAARLGEVADRREEAKEVLIRLEAKANTQRALQWQAIAAPDRFDQLREPEQVVRGQIAAILAELAALRPGDPSVHRVIAATPADLGTIAVAALATMLTLVLLLQIERAKARQRAAEARVQQERARLVHKVLTAAEQQRAGLAAELHDGPIQALTGLTLGLERSRLRLQRGRTDEGVELLVSVQGRLAAEIQSPWVTTSGSSSGRPGSAAR